MATTFLEPGGDADFGINFWTNIGGGLPTTATDFVHSPHIKSLKYPFGSTNVLQANAVLNDSGSRFSFYLYIKALPTSANSTFVVCRQTGIGSVEIKIILSSSGVLRLFESSAQIGSDGSTLSTGTWYRISVAYTTTSASINEFRLFKNGVIDISVTNATLTSTGAVDFEIGCFGDVTMDLRTSDHYIDNSSLLIDTGNIWVTAKRPNANGTANNFTTQIGSGGSGYGTGHSPQVNERPLSNTNGWSIVAVGATTEEYNIEGKSTGDIDISNATTFDLLKEDGSNLLQEGNGFILLENANQNVVIDYMGWLDYKTVLSETASIVINGVNTPFTSTANAETMFTKITGFGGYPAGTGKDIGMISDATATTVSLYECGVIVAYIPAVVTPVTTIYNGNQFFQLMGVGT